MASFLTLCSSLKANLSMKSLAGGCMLEFCPHNLTNDTACCSLPLKHKVKKRQRERVLWGRSGPLATPEPARKKERNGSMCVYIKIYTYIYPTLIPCTSFPSTVLPTAYDIFSNRLEKTSQGCGRRCRQPVFEPGRTAAAPGDSGSGDVGI